MKKLKLETFLLIGAAAFAAYNFGLAGGYIEGTHFSIGGLVAGVVVNISLAIASSRFGSLKGIARTRQARLAFVLMLVLAPALVSPVIYYSLPASFLVPWMRVAWSIAWPLVADLAIVLAGAVSGKGLIPMHDNEEATHALESAPRSAPSAVGVRPQSKRSADAVRSECAALQAQYACTHPQCGWSPDAGALYAAARAGKNPRSAAASAKAGHVKAKHPKLVPVDGTVFQPGGEQ